MVHARLVLVVAAILALAGCAGVRQQVGGWLGETPPPAASQGTIYYSAVDGLPVHADAARSAKVVGKLALHQKVVRSRLEAGWAYVDADGVSGWVDNAQLIWRLPDAGAAPAAAPAKTAQQQPAAPDTTGATVPPNPTATPVESAPAPTAEPTVEPAPTATPAPSPAPTTAPTAPPAAPKKAAPDIFDPY